jgi:hypothetical protein
MPNGTFIDIDCCTLNEHGLSGLGAQVDCAFADALFEGLAQIGAGQLAILIDEGCEVTDDIDRTQLGAEHQVELTLV